MALAALLVSDLAASRPSEAPVATTAQSAHPDLSGFWHQALSTPPIGPPIIPLGLPRPWFFLDLNGWTSSGTVSPPLRPAAIEFVRQHELADFSGHTTDDRTLKCQAPLFYDVAIFPDLLDFMQRDDEIVMMSEKERAIPRHIFIGREHPQGDEMTPTINGDATGLWKGDTLVVDTIGFDPNTFLFVGDFIPHSDELHVQETYRLGRGGNTLAVQWTMIDPKTFTKPWIIRFTLERAPNSWKFEHQACDIEHRN